MDNSNLPKGQSVEGNGNKRPKNQPGIYRHEGSKKEVITSADPNDGVVQADAFVRVGYHWIGPVPTKEEMAKRRVERDVEAAEEAKKEVPGEKKEQFNGTSEFNAQEEKEKRLEAEAKLAETQATLSALQEGLKNKKEDKKEEEK